MSKSQCESERRNAHVKIQFGIAPEMCEFLERLRLETGAATRAEVLRRAASLYGTLWDELKDGGRLELVSADGERHRVVIVR